MRILCLMSQDVFRLTLGWALESIGHEVCYLGNVHKDTFIDIIHTFRPQILLDVGWDRWHCKESQVEMVATIIKQYGLFHVYFAEEDSLHFERWSKPYVMKMAPDFVLTRGKNCVESYKQLNIQAAYMDVGCNPEFHRPLQIQPNCDVSVVANVQFTWNIFRRKSIQDLVIPLFDREHSLKVWGRDWDQTNRYYGKKLPESAYQGYLPYHHTPQVYNSSKINISIQSVEDQISNRTYDILASGTFLLTSDTPCVRERLKPGVNCEVSNSPEETLEKVSFYLKHDTVREKIARKGRSLAKNQLAYQKTLPSVLAQIEQIYEKLGGRMSFEEKFEEYSGNRSYLSISTAEN